MNEQNMNQENELADLEPIDEVKGGDSLPSAPVVDLQLNPKFETLASGISKLGSKRLVISGDGPYQG